MRNDRRHARGCRAPGVLLALTAIVLGACREEPGASAPAPPQPVRAAVAPAAASTDDTPGDERARADGAAADPSPDEAPTPVARTMVIEDRAVAVAAAEELFTTRCAPCHGARGLGDGRLAPNLSPRPRSFADAAWQANVTDTFLEQIIRDGGPAVGRSPLMPASPDLVERPAVLAALRERVRALGRAP
jgi:mono/diheme cytochrome c family protein